MHAEDKYLFDESDYRTERERLTDVDCLNIQTSNPTCSRWFYLSDIAVFKEDLAIRSVRFPIFCKVVNFFPNFFYHTTLKSADS